jgi:anti-anti-sigma factor
MLKVHTKKLETVAILSLRGQIVTGDAESLRTAVQSLSDVRAVILDLAHVNTLDAGGLGVLLALRERAQAEGIRFELINVSRWVSKVLQVVRLDSVFQVVSAVDFFPAGSRHHRAVTPRLASCA